MPYYDYITGECVDPEDYTEAQRERLDELYWDAVDRATDRYMEDGV